MQKIIHPAYSHFSCLANGCTEQCCSVFRVTMFRWEQKLFDSKPEWQDVDGLGSSFSDNVQYKDGICSLNRKDGACTFLTSEGLCSLQKRFGVGALPSICRTYPRLITRLEDRVEYALDPCCAYVLDLMKEWTPGQMEITGGPEPSDEVYLKRKRAMALFADDSISVAEAVVGMASIYGIAFECAAPGISPVQSAFLRRAIAATIWAYVLPFRGHHLHPEPMAVIVEFLAGYLPHISDIDTEDWHALSLDYSGALSDFENRIGFDDEVEEHYIDMLQD